VAIAEKMKLVAESAKVRAGRIKLFMANDVSSGFEIEQPVDERRLGTNLQGAMIKTNAIHEIARNNTK
jgi:hypothetical protein